MQAECFGLGGILGSTTALPFGAAKASSSTANTWCPTTLALAEGGI